MSPFRRILYSLSLVAIGLALIASGMAVERFIREGKHSPSEEKSRPPGQDPDPSHLAASAANGAAVPAGMADPNLDRSAADPLAASGPASPNIAQSLLDEGPLDLANQIALADEALKMGDFAAALRGYDEAWPPARQGAAASLLFRKGLAAEALGEHALALDCYREMILAAKGPRWAGLGLIGNCRCWIATKRPKMIAAEVLPKVLLDPTGLSESARAELLHLSAMAASVEEWERPDQDLLMEDVLVVPLWRVDPILVLDQLPGLLSDGRFPQRQSEFRIVQKLDDSAEGTFLSLGAPRTNVASLLRALVQSAGASLSLSPRAADLLAGHTAVANADDQSLALLLDGICIPHELIWSMEKQAVTVRTAEESTPDDRRNYARKSSRRLLQLAVTLAPAHPLAVWNRIAWGRVLFRLGASAEGVGMFRGVLNERTTPELAAAAAFNLGKCLMSLGQFADAEAAFLQCVDAGGRDAILAGTAYLYVGRLLLEQGKTRQANSPCMRALTLCQGSRQEPDAAMILACHYLLSRNPQAANSVLMEHREAFTSPLHRDSSAFLASLARFDAAVLADRREREARSLTTALTHMHPEKNFGAHWWLLVGGAFGKVGLAENAAETYLAALKVVQNSPLRAEVLMNLAATDMELGRGPEAEQVLAVLTSAERQEIRWPALLRAAQLSLEQGHLQEAVDRCRELLAGCDDDPTRRQALRILGKAYQAREDYAAAIACFSGQLPEPDAADNNAPDDQQGGRNAE